uniref:Carboxylic ester hydrolase n=1 Tax=Panagrellus redivivus TaxID=6233 RepID=A0A7E4ZT83_PANRE
MAILAAVVFGAFFTLANCDGNVIVETTRGTVTGFKVDYGNDTSQLYYGQADVFLGIRYVQPPVGALRFAKPVPLTKFKEQPYDATQFGDACPQKGNARGYNMSEDCLVLNIYTPDALSVYKYSVMVFIHGGSLKDGLLGDFPTPGIVRNLVSRGVVVVALQYRIGLLGYFTTHSDEFPPNLGLMDQTEALKWIQQEIANFGGDPYRITLMGQSAGSSSVAALLLSPVSQNLFQQAIMESGSILTCFEGAMGFTKLSQNRAIQLCNFGEDQWDARNFTALKEDCLQDMDWHNFLEYEDSNIRGWMLVQDDYMLPATPRDLAKNRPNIPVIYGNCKDEWSGVDLALLAGGYNISTYNREYFEFIFAVYANYLGENEETVIGILESVYMPPGLADDDHVGWLKTMSDIFTSAGFTGFTAKEVEWYLENGNDQVYTYEFVFPTDIHRVYNVPGWKPVFHGAELDMVLMQDYFWEPLLKNGTLSPDDVAVANFMGRTWTNFAKYSTPLMDGSWTPTKTAQNFEYLEINVQQTMKTGFRTADKLVWNKVLPQIIGIWPPNVPDYNNGTVSL